MASRRRLDISSLLCDNEQTSASPSTPASASTTGQVSRSSALSPPDQRQQHQRRLHEAQPDPLTPTSGPYTSPQYEHFEGRRLEGRPGSTYRESPGVLPSATVLTPLPLVLQPSPARRWTPPPPITLPPTSPLEYTNTERSYLGRRSEELHESGFPRPQHYLTHPHPYTQYPLPDSSTSPVNVHSLDIARSASIELRSNRFSPALPPHLSSSSSLPDKLSSTVHSFSVSPTDLSHSTRPSTSSSGDRYSRHSPVLSRLPEARTFLSQRASASPTVPMSGLSGLDVLVQAATEERERIDVHRRYSGGDEPQSSSHNAFRRTSLSPVGRRTDMRLQTMPPSPPHTASPGTTRHLPNEGTGAYYERNIHGEDERAVKRWRSSHGPPYSQELDFSLALEHSPRVESPSPDSSLGRRSHSLDAHRGKDEYRHDGMGPISHPASSNSSRVHVSKPGSQYTQSSSVRTATHPMVSEESHASPPSHHAHPLTPVEPPAITHARRSPPRSKPRPKKPGSAALAMMEKEFREVALSNGDRRTAEDHDGLSPRKSVTKPESSWAQTHVKTPGLNSRSRQSNERGAADDEDVDDFFLSTFESPRPAEKQIPSRDKSSAVAPSSETDKDVYSAAQRSRGHQKHFLTSHPASSSSKLRNPSTEQLNDTLEVFSPARPANEPVDEVLMSEVEAEILDEIADAAGAATSEDERTEFDDQETDNMEVDVENELLSLIDGPTEHDSKPHHPPGPTSFHTQKNLTSVQHADFDRMSMPPPDAFKGSKKGLSKSKVKEKEKVFDVAMSGRVAPPQIDTTEDRPSKSKTTSKSRPKKDISSEKTKAVKVSKIPSTPTSATLPTSCIDSPNPNTPTDEAFPMVTSSGRMITKSKKSAAAASTDPVKQPSSSHHKKKPAISGSGNATPRSRSHSVMPRASVDPENRREKGPKDEQEKFRDGAGEDAESMDEDKLYCICRTPYDDDRVMIACDRCDEWYHTQCVNMPDALIDLVDQFICLNCIAQNPSLNLRTTYKQRCFAGLKHPNPDSSDACHKSSRGVYSKYCSDECGVRFMHRKIAIWASNEGDIRGLWESVKDAKRREGFVTSEPGRTLPKAILAEIQNNMLAKSEGDVSEVKQGLPDGEGRSKFVAKLEEQLQMVVREREELKKELEIVACRERLLQLASERAESIGGCGWDQRLVYGDEEWLEFGADVLDSYEDAAPNGHMEENGDMDVDGQAPACEWWCTGKKKCERHMGWQRVRAADIEKERIMKESALADLTRREREIRSQIEDVLHPQSRSVVSFPESTFNFKLANGSLEAGMKKTKKKSPAAV